MLKLEFRYSSAISPHPLRIRPFNGHRMLKSTLLGRENAEQKLAKMIWTSSGMPSSEVDNYFNLINTTSAKLCFAACWFTWKCAPLSPVIDIKHSGQRPECWHPHRSSKTPSTATNYHRWQIFTCIGPIQKTHQL